MSERRLEDLRAEVWRVMALGQRLHSDAWNEQSMCERWTVADVYAHLAGDFDRWLGWLEDAIQGRADPPFPRGELAADNEIILERYAGISGPERLLAFEEGASRYIGALAGVDPETPQGNPLGTITVGEQVVWATIECALHGWDVAEALGMNWEPPGSLDHLLTVWARRRAEPLEAADPWTALLVASGRVVP